MLFWVLLIGGLLIVALVVFEVVWSTISTNGGGPLTMGMTAGTWKLARGLMGWFPHHRILETASAVILVMTFVVWLVPLWVGWTMVFSASVEAVVEQMTHEPSTLMDRAYFAAMVLLTLGTGDFVASSPGWRLLSVAAAANGLVVVTLAITYLISVVSAVMEKRRLAISVGALGGSAGEIVVNGWDGQGFTSLEDELSDVAGQLMLHAERHLAYPILQYFHPTDPRAALPRAVVKLEDATTLLSSCVADEHQPNRSTLRMLRRAIDIYLARVQLAHVSEVDSPPPMPDIDALERAGVPLRGFRCCREAVARRTDRRRLLKGLVISEAWEWPGDRRS